MAAWLVISVFGLGLILEAGRGPAARFWEQAQRPARSYRHDIPDGLAVSLNALEQAPKLGGWLPGLDIRGVLHDSRRGDWILFGDARADRRGLPVDALAVALRAVRVHLEAPGVDMRPRRTAAGADRHLQTVRYFGGVEGTIVGEWFFRFDHFMKRASLDQVPLAASGVPVYWRRAIEALERDVQTCDGTQTGEFVRGNRYWLCAAEFTAIESDQTLVFEDTPLRILAERVSPGREPGSTGASPCTTRGTDDTLAEQFARWLDDHLDDLTAMTPIGEISGFARLLAGLTWLTEQDPGRDLRPWLRRTSGPAETPTSVPTTTVNARREHTVSSGAHLFVHEHRLELSGGVLIAPSTIRARAADASVRDVRRAVLTARPGRQSLAWSFSFRAPYPEGGAPR